jgi:hypothetical protein
MGNFFAFMYLLVAIHIFCLIVIAVGVLKIMTLIRESFEKQNKMLLYVCQYIKRKPDAAGIPFDSSFNTSNINGVKDQQASGEVTVSLAVALKAKSDATSANICTLEAGEKVEILKTENDTENTQWCNVRTKDGTEGWVAAKYLKKT